MYRDLNICDIKAVTFYTDKDFEGMSDKQVYAMKCRIFADIDRFCKEIIKFFKENPDKRTMSDDDVRLLNYIQLRDLRNSLGLGKKKVKSTSDGTEVAKKARKALPKDPKQLTLDIIVSAEEHERQESLLYLDEIIQMGYGDYTREELAEIGIIPLDMKKSHSKK